KPDVLPIGTVFQAALCLVPQLFDTHSADPVNTLAQRVLAVDFARREARQQTKGKQGNKVLEGHRAILAEEYSLDGEVRERQPRITRRSALGGHRRARRRSPGRRWSMARARFVRQAPTPG